MQFPSHTDSRSDEQLLQRAGRGDERAFAVLYERLSGRLYALALRLLGDEQEACDALQEGFVHLWEKAPEFSPSKGKAFAWLVTLFRNKTIDLARVRRRRQQLTEEGAEEIPSLLAESSEPAENAAHRSERAAVVRSALESLPAAQRKCIEWAFLKGDTQHELAERLGQPLVTVKSNIRHGLVQLRQLLMGGAK